MLEIAEYLSLNSTVLSYSVWPVFAVEGPLIIAGPSLSPVDVEKGTPRHKGRMTYTHYSMYHLDSGLIGLKESYIFH